MLEQALVHRSYLNEHARFPFGSNERLEYLGDAVVGLIVSDYLYRNYPDAPEGVLTAMRATLVRAQTLGKVALAIRLGDLLYVSKGEAAAGGRAAQRLLGQAYEALVGAIYLDQGYKVAQSFVLEGLAPDLAKVQSEYQYIDPKSRLQELTQARLGVTPTYELVETTGPGHRPHFVFEARVGEKVIGTGEGDTKQDAEEAAARVALDRFRAESAES